MKTVTTKSGQTFLLDDEDHALLHDMRMSAIGGKPGKRYLVVRDESKPKETIYVHRLVIGCFEKGICVDHINGDVCDNRKENLRRSVKSTNGGNMGKHRDNSTGYKGVYESKVKSLRTRKWIARVCKDRKQYNIGMFNSPEEAARAYNEKAKELFGEFARLNVIKDG